MSDVAGTTRDALDTPYQAPDGARFTLVDTAGVRRRASVAAARDGAEELSVQRALRALRRADVAVLVLDATQPATQQDQRLAQFAAEHGRACVLVVNKCDTVMGSTEEAGFSAAGSRATATSAPITPPKFPSASMLADRELELRASLRAVEWANVVFCSAASGQRVPRVLEAVAAAAREHRRRVPTATLNLALREAVGWRPPPALPGGKRPRVLYATQAAACPPTFVVFTNLSSDRARPERMPEEYTRYIERQLREQVGFEGTPLRIHWRARAGGREHRSSSRAGR